MLLRNLSKIKSGMGLGFIPRQPRKLFNGVLDLVMSNKCFSSITQNYSSLVHFHAVSTRKQDLCSMNISCRTTCNIVDIKTHCQTRSKHTKVPEDLLPELDENDLQESFVKGSGPGGQAVNKTNNCVVLQHVPTNLVVKCHETRSLEKNRQLARLRMRHELDAFYNGSNSVLEIMKRQDSAKRDQRRQRTNKRLEKLRAFKEREGVT